MWKFARSNLQGRSHFGRGTKQESRVIGAKAKNSKKSQQTASVKDDLTDKLGRRQVNAGTAWNSVQFISEILYQAQGKEEVSDLLVFPLLQTFQLPGSDLDLVGVFMGLGQGLWFSWFLVDLNSLWFLSKLSSEHFGKPFDRFVQSGCGRWQMTDWKHIVDKTLSSSSWWHWTHLFWFDSTGLKMKGLG